MVESTIIENIQEDDIEVENALNTVWFNDESNCSPLCVDINIDPCKV